MVLYKRKQVQITVPQLIPDDSSTEVFVIRQTNEWFVTYEEYLERLDYYNKRKFVCEITGNSCLTFFEALRSEIKEIEDLNRHFPDALKEHVLKFLQFNRITRLDQLVDKVYLQFKNNYFPGEYVLLKGINLGATNSEIAGMKHHGLVREKVEFAGQPTKYLVVRLSDGQEAIATGDKIYRDRNHFTKYLIKTFIKLTMARSHKIGAPWVVKKKFAKKYRIPQEYPPDLKQYESTTLVDDDDSDTSLIRHFLKPLPIAEKKSTGKSNATGKKGRKDAQTDLSTIKPKAEKNSKNMKKVSLKSLLDGETKTPPVVDSPPKPKRLPLLYFPDNLRKTTASDEGVTSDRPGTMASLQSVGIAPTKKNIVSDSHIKFDIQNCKPVPHKFELPENALDWNKQLVEFIEEKEDKQNVKSEDNIDVELISETVTINEDDDQNDENDENEDNDENEEDGMNRDIDLLSVDKSVISSKFLVSMQEALQSWVFVNIYHQPLKIDTFTFDDFVFAMGWNYDQFTEIGRCELLDEIWCSLLGAMVSNKLPSSAETKEYKENEEIFGLQIRIPSNYSYINPIKNEDNEPINGSESEHENNAGSLGSELEDEDSESESDTKTKTKSEKRNGVKHEEMDGDDGNDGDDEREDAESEAGNGTKTKKETSVLSIDSDEDEEAVDDGDDDVINEHDEDESREHNAYILMNHRGIPWHDRLRKRNFRDGNWQTILLGILSLVEHIPKYQTIIQRVYRILAPIDETPNPTTALNQYYERMDINLRFETLNILCDLLATSDMVRNHIDQSLDESASLRRRRLDNIKDFKGLLDKGQKLQQSIFDNYLELTNNKDNEEVAKRKPRFDITQVEMSDEEKKIADINFDFKKRCEERKGIFLKLDELKTEKKSLERQLVELDCQRVRCLGKDRLFNRYWWFENNGLPTLHGSAEGEDENEEDKLDDDESSNEDVSEETYLMGKLWVQGPSDDDLRIHLKCEELQHYRNDLPESQVTRIEHDVPTLRTFDDKPLQELNYSSVPAEFKQLASESGNLEFAQNEIKQKLGSTIINNFGLLTDSSMKDNLSPIQRKFIEECPDPLFNGSNWRYYDNKEDIEKLISWLNPYGTRESQLKKELSFVKDAIYFSIEARNKAFSDKERIEKHAKISEQIKQIDGKLLQLGESNNTAAADYDDDEDEPIEVNRSRKRNLRTKPKNSKRQKRGFDDILIDGEEFELQETKSELLEQLNEPAEAKELTRVLEWVNSLAIEKFDRSLYDGGDKARSKSRR